MRRKRRHHGPLAWQKAIGLVERAYTVTSAFPSHENFGLIAQCRRASVSVASNIAEGAARNSQKEFLQFLGIARGSLSELETQFIISTKLGYIHNDAEIFDAIDELFGLLGGLVKSIRNRESS